MPFLSPFHMGETRWLGAGPMSVTEPGCEHRSKGRGTHSCSWSLPVLPPPPRPAVDTRWASVVIRPDDISLCDCVRAGIRVGNLGRPHCQWTGTSEGGGRPGGRGLGLEGAGEHLPQSQSHTHFRMPALSPGLLGSEGPRVLPGPLGWGAREEGHRASTEACRPARGDGCAMREGLWPCWLCDRGFPNPGGFMG